MLATPCADAFRDLDEPRVEFVVRSGRFPEERNVELHLSMGGVQRRLLVLKVFYGRPPHYRRWVEVFSIASSLTFNGRVFVFAGSVYEERLIECLSMFLEGGERLFIEYIYDDETRRGLELGVPPPLTRLGYMLIQKGFTWFKDWYFPEGFMEGSPKLQAEKPVDEGSRRRHLEELCREVEGSMNRVRGLAALEEYSWAIKNVLKRVEGTLKLCRDL
ncbi:MAG: DUF1122 family protein [Ignisphaera sp.]|nr:DUF1122 family protein [Ignisphaera sp.]MDW8085611.1 DUF1122 family protein [Ignisphaera sp.]